MRLCLILSVLSLVGSYLPAQSNKPEPPIYQVSDTITLKAGQSFILQFPELAKMNGGDPGACEVYVPLAYSPEARFPLFVWFAGGRGSERLQSPFSLVDADNFIVVALPYPNRQKPRLAVNDGNITSFWDFQAPMLQAVKRIVPNIDTHLRFVAGQSSGAHLIGSALDLDWQGFSDYFTYYVMHEGSYCPNMAWTGLHDDHEVLVTYGEKSASKAWQTHFMSQFRTVHPRATFIEIEGAPHALNEEGRQIIRDWITEQVAALGN